MLNKSFDNIWEKIHSTQEWGQYPNEDVIRFIARNYYNKKGGGDNRKNIKILDFGCGAGANTWYLAREEFDVYAFDGSESAVKKAQSKLENDNLHATFKVCDALYIDYDNEYFDCIIDSAVIYSNLLSNINKMYQKIYDMLKIGGKFFTTGNFTLNVTGYNTGVEIEKNTFRDLKEGPLANRGTIHFFSDIELKELLLNVGFKNIKLDKLKRTEKNQIYTIEYYILEATK